MIHCRNTDGGRLRGLVTPDIGSVLHPDDLPADKVRALWNRARLLLIELAAAKDSGFTPAAFVDSLRAITRLGPADWAEDGASSNDVEPLRSRFNAWREQLMQSDADSESSAE